MVAADTYRKEVSLSTETGMRKKSFVIGLQTIPNRNSNAPEANYHEKNNTVNKIGINL